LDYLKSTHMINQWLMYMVGFYDRNGKICTLVKEMEQIFVVDKSPLEILAYSIKCIGFDMRGAFASSKWILGDDILMHPVMVNPIHKICLFPNKSAKLHDTIWFNPYYIKRTTGSMRKTVIEFQNGETLKIECQLSSFNHKLQTAEQLRNMTTGIGIDPITFIFTPKKTKGRAKRKSKKSKAV
jgi:competence protein ComK